MQCVELCKSLEKCVFRGIYRGTSFVLATTTDGKPRGMGRNEPCPCGSGKKFKKCCGAGEPPRKATGGRLAETLDRILEPRLAPGKRGRTKGAGNYDWTPEMDQLLEFWRTRDDQGDAAPEGWLAKAKNIMAKRLMKLCPRESTPRKDSLRRAVERHMASLGLSGNHRKRAEPDPAECTKKAKEVSSGAWTPGEISALLATVGGDLINGSQHARAGARASRDAYEHK